MSALGHRLACGWLGLAAAAATSTFALAGDRATSPPPAADTDARIAYYRARIGGPATYPAYARLGLALLQKERETGEARYSEEALRHLRRSLASQRSYEGLLGMAMGLAQHHGFREALAYAKEAVAALPADPQALGVLFDIQLGLGDVRAAETTVNTLLASQPGVQAWTRLAALREYQGNLAAALEAMLKARDTAAADKLPVATQAWIAVRVGSLHMARCDPAQARQAYDRALELVPGYFWAREHLAEWHAAQGQWDEAVKLFEQLQRTHPDPDYRLALAKICRRQGKTARARQEEDKALAELKESVHRGAQDRFRPLALLLLERDSTAAEALEWAQRDWELRQEALAADTLAWAYARNGRFEAAMALSEQALATGTRAPAVELHGGLIRCYAGRTQAGRPLLERALACPLALAPAEWALAELARAELARAPTP